MAHALTFKQQDAASYLASKGVRFVIRTNYENNRPVSSDLLGTLPLTKTGKFYRIDGKIVSRGMAAFIARLGWLHTEAA